MPISIEDVIAQEELESRLQTLLPELYRNTYEDLTPVSMGSAGLRYDAAGRVAWNEIWATFCDLAMAGGPPHRGSLLQSADPADAAANPEAYSQVVEEICRGVAMVTGLTAQPAALRGWVRLECESAAMAAWLTRAIVMENVLARHERELLYLPAGPEFRIEKEIKNVVTVMAKTCHYWKGHTPPDQQRAIARLLTETADTPALLEPFLSNGLREPDQAYQDLVAAIGATIARETGMRALPHRYPGWIGVECPGIQAAVWMMRALVADNVLARREETVLFLPVNPGSDPEGERVTRALATTCRFAAARKVL